MERIHPRKGPALHRHADHRQGGERGNHARQVGRPAGPGDDHLQAAAGGGAGEVHHLEGGAVGREHPHLNGHPEALQQRHGRLHRGQIGIAAHDHGHGRIACRAARLQVGGIGGNHGTKAARMAFSRPNHPPWSPPATVRRCRIGRVSPG